MCGLCVCFAFLLPLVVWKETTFDCHLNHREFKWWIWIETGIPLKGNDVQSDFRFYFLRFEKRKTTCNGPLIVLVFNLSAFAFCVYINHWAIFVFFLFQKWFYLFLPNFPQLKEQIKWNHWLMLAFVLFLFSFRATYYSTMWLCGLRGGYWWFFQRLFASSILSRRSIIQFDTYIL